MEKWYFTKEQLANTPSRSCGIDAGKELNFRQEATWIIQTIGQRLQVSQLCINTAMVCMHRFYMFHSFSRFPAKTTMVAATLFLAAKVEEQPRRMERVIKATQLCLQSNQPPTEMQPKEYEVLVQNLLFNENLLLQTLGFEVDLKHPHMHIVNFSKFPGVSRDLTDAAYRMATKSLRLTTMCLQYPPTVVAVFCINLACKASNIKIPKSSEGLDWFHYIDPSVTLDLLERLGAEFQPILERPSSKPKRGTPQNLDKSAKRISANNGRGHEALTSQPQRELLHTRHSQDPTKSGPVATPQAPQSATHPSGAAARVHHPSLPPHHPPAHRRDQRPDQQRYRTNSSDHARRSVVTEARDHARRQEALARHANKPPPPHQPSGVSFLPPTRRDPAPHNDSPDSDRAGVGSHDSGLGSWTSSQGSRGSLGSSSSRKEHLLSTLYGSKTTPETSHSGAQEGESTHKTDNIKRHPDDLLSRKASATSVSDDEKALQEMCDRRSLQAFFGNEDLARLAENRQDIGKVMQEMSHKRNLEAFYSDDMAKLSAKHHAGTRNASTKQLCSLSVKCDERQANPTLEHIAKSQNTEDSPFQPQQRTSSIPPISQSQLEAYLSRGVSSLIKKSLAQKSGPPLASTLKPKGLSPVDSCYRCEPFSRPDPKNRVNIPPSTTKVVPKPPNQVCTGPALKSISNHEKSSKSDLDRNYVVRTPASTAKVTVEPQSLIPCSQPRPRRIFSPDEQLKPDLKRTPPGTGEVPPSIAKVEEHESVEVSSLKILCRPENSSRPGPKSSRSAKRPPSPIKIKEEPKSPNEVCPQPSVRSFVSSEGSLRPDLKGTNQMCLQPPPESIFSSKKSSRPCPKTSHAVKTLPPPIKIKEEPKSPNQLCSQTPLKSVVSSEGCSRPDLKGTNQMCLQPPPESIFNPKKSSRSCSKTSHVVKTLPPPIKIKEEPKSPNQLCSQTPVKSVVSSEGCSRPDLKGTNQMCLQPPPESIFSPKKSSRSCPKTSHAVKPLPPPIKIKEEPKSPNQLCSQPPVKSISSFKEETVRSPEHDVPFSLREKFKRPFAEAFSQRSTGIGSEELKNSRIPARVSVPVSIPVSKLLSIPVPARCEPSKTTVTASDSSLLQVSKEDQVTDKPVKTALEDIRQEACSISADPLVPLPLADSSPGSDHFRHKKGKQGKKEKRKHKERSKPEAGIPRFEPLVEPVVSIAHRSLTKKHRYPKRVDPVLGPSESLKMKIRYADSLRATPADAAPKDSGRSRGSSGISEGGDAEVRIPRIDPGELPKQTDSMSSAHARRQSALESHEGDCSLHKAPADRGVYLGFGRSGRS